MQFGRPSGVVSQDLNHKVWTTHDANGHAHIEDIDQANVVEVRNYKVSQLQEHVLALNWREPGPRPLERRTSGSYCPVYICCSTFRYLSYYLPRRGIHTLEGSALDCRTPSSTYEELLRVPTQEGRTDVKVQTR